MKLGVVFPQTEIGADPAAIRQYTIAVEQMGFDYLLSYDHVLGADPDRPGGWRGPYTYKDSFHEPFVLYSYLSALTTSLEFVTGILVLPQRQTALVAKQAAELAILSEGRLRLGVGVGWNYVEFEGLGEDFLTRGRRSEEQVILLKRLWEERLINFQGDFHTFNNVGINPLPDHPIPIWFGGGADVVLRRMARLGDGWMPKTAPPEKIAPYLKKLRTYLEEEGRDPAAFGIDIRMSERLQPPETWPSLIEGYLKLGATHISINTMGMDYTSIEQHLDAIRRFKEQFA